MYEPQHLEKAHSHVPKLVKPCRVIWSDIVGDISFTVYSIECFGGIPDLYPSASAVRAKKNPKELSPRLKTQMEPSLNEDFDMN